MLDFLVIGSQKCGTTWLFDKLKMHPRLYFPVGKEGNYWNHKFYEGKFYRSCYHAAMHGPVVDICQYLCGEMTPEYAIMTIQQIQTLKAHHPDIPIFLMVRNPIERAWSAVKMTYRYHKLNIASLSEQQAILAITTGKTAALGQYDRIIQNWLSVFDASQFHLLFFDDLTTGYRAMLNQVCAAVQADALTGNSFFDQIPDAVLSQPSMVGLQQSLSSEVYAACLDFYQPSIQFLEAYSNRHLLAWRNPGTGLSSLSSLSSQICGASSAGSKALDSSSKLPSGSRI